MPQVGKNRQQLDLLCDRGEAEAEVERLVSLGARRSPEGRAADDEVRLLDPDGNWFSLFPIRR